MRTAAEEAGMVAFLADTAVSTRDVLDFDCGLYSDSAKHIDLYRQGKAGGDGSIDSEAELDSVHQVGPATIDAVYACTALLAKTRLAAG